MSGHSKWSTIKRQKGAADIKRGQTFTKIANAIAIVVKQGGSGDPNSNPRLRMVLESARAMNMPKENVQRAIERGLGKGKEVLEEVIYEGFGPGHVAFYIEGITDNKLRTNQEIKSIFERNGGSLAGSGSVAYMFEKKGEIKVKGKGVSREDEMLELIDLGAEDVEDFEEDGAQKYLIYVLSSDINSMSNKLDQSGYAVESQEIVMKPKVTQNIQDPEMAKKITDFTKKLEDQSDIQEVYSNFDFPENFI